MAIDRRDDNSNLLLMFYDDNNQPGCQTFRHYIQALPNLRVVDFNQLSRWDVEICQTLNDRRNIVGISLDTKNWSRHVNTMMANLMFKNIKMLATLIKETIEASLIADHAESLEQLFVTRTIARKNVSLLLSQCKNLRRFHFETPQGFFSRSKSPNETLEILEISYQDGDDIAQDLSYYLTKCPNLKSIYLRLGQVRRCLDCFVFKEIKVYKSLENLAIEFTANKQPITWEKFGSFITRFPKVKNLALRNNPSINDQAVLGFIQCLPSLELIDLRGTSAVNSDAITKKYSICHKERTIDCWVGPLPKLHSIPDHVVAHEFDFMDNIFLRDFCHIPRFLID